MSDTDTGCRTAAATVAAARAARERRITRAADLLRAEGWSVAPPRHGPEVHFNDLGQHVTPHQETTYRCPVDGKESWYVRAADRFYHCDGTDNTRCLRAMHRGELRWPMPKVLR